MRTWSVRGIESVRLLVTLAAQHGVAATECLRGSGIAAEALEDPLCEVGLDARPASSFVHAFKRWKGVSPTAYRRRAERSRP